MQSTPDLRSRRCCLKRRSLRRRWGRRSKALVAFGILSHLSTLDAAGWSQQPSAPTRADSSLEELRDARRLAAEDPAQGTPKLIRALGRVGAWAEAEKLARNLLDADSTADHALLLAWTLRRQDRIDAAIRVLETQLDPNDGTRSHGVRRELALLHLATGDPARGLEVIESAPVIDAGVRGLALAALPGRGEDAARSLRTALEQPDDTVVPEDELVRELGTILLDGGDAAAALPYLRSAAEAVPDDPDAAYRLALALRSLGETDQARAAMETFQALRIAADQRETERRALGARLNEVQERAQQNRLDEALLQVDEIVATYPDSYSALALRAKIRFSLGRGEDALVDIRRARDLEPGISEFHYLEGLFERTLGNNEPARNALQRALALSPELVEAHALLGGIELDLGAPEAALEHLETAKALGASGAQIERAIAIARDRAGASP